MARFIVAAPAPLRPDPDETSPAIMALAANQSVELLRRLESWAKISLIDKAGQNQIGWVPADVLKESQARPLELYDNPFSPAPNKTAGEIVEVKGSLPPWKMVRARLEDGSVVDGWMKDEAGATPQTPPAPPVEAAELDLGVNEIYRPYLLKARQIAGLDAAAIAALVDAEAAKISSGPHKGRWNSRSMASTSSAAGLTQFLGSTWIDLAETRDTQLNKAAKARGLVDQVDRAVADRKRDLLALRFDPELSIVSAAEYGRSNFAALAADGAVDADLGDDEKARYIYLAHHEGLQGAKNFLSGANVHTRADLVRQAGESRADFYLSASQGDGSRAYRAWLNDYMDAKIQPNKFRRKGPAAAASAALAQFSGSPIPIALLGGKSDLVVAIQSRLCGLGYLDPPADGIFGEVSKWALNEFADRNQLAFGDGFTEAMARKLLAPTGLLPEIRDGGSWFDKVVAYMTRRGYFICRHPDCKNIVYLEGVDPDGGVNDDAPNKFNDLRAVFFIDEDGKPQWTAWDGTTEPGYRWTVSPMNPRGAARIAFNQYKAWVVGTHKAGTPSAHEALVQAAPVTVHRDLNKDFKRTGDEIDTGLFAINQHWGYDAPAGDLENTSAGCLVGRTKDGHRKFMALVKGDPRYKVSHAYKFLTAVIPGDAALAPR